MADLPTGFWSGWILVLTLVSLAALLWLTLSIYLSKEKHKSSEPETVWDQNLREGNSAPPLWWFWLLLASMVFSLVYLMLFPGLGSYPGLLNWSQGSRLMASHERYEARFAPKREAIASASLSELKSNSELMRTADRIFRRECAACHGQQGQGQANLFPNLMDASWQWGGQPEQIELSIRNGRQAQMPGWQAAVGDEGVEQLSAYLLTQGSEADVAHPGKIRYQQFCAACHGPERQGNPIFGAPDLSDDIWLYGGTVDQIKASIAMGRNGQMPAFDQRLDDMQIRLLVARLSQPDSTNAP